MLENFVLIPDSLTPSTSRLFAAVVAYILTIAVLLWMFVPRVTWQCSSRIRKYGIVAAFFVLALSASATFAGDWMAPIPQLSALESCKVESAKTSYYPVISKACEYDSQLPQCPSQKDGGYCEESALFYYKANSSVAGAGTPYSVSRVRYNYCPDSAPKWNGSACVAQDPCSSKGGQAVDDGSVGPDNTKLSMSFPRREDDNYVGQTFCSAGCKAAVDKEVGSSGGYFDGKYVGQFSAKFSGQSCSPASPQATPKTTPALIPKTSAEYDCVSKGMAYGYVNDTVKCVTPSETKAVEKKASETIKADGSKTKETRSDNTVCANGVCTTTTTTITTEYNSSGTETGTTTKTESTSKPDPNSGLGTGGAGTGKDGMACGGPGQPTCAVKVDETGTPTDMSPITAQKQAMESVMDEYKAKLAEVTGPKTWGLTWSYSLPTGTCTALQFGAGRFTTSLDVCKPLGYVRDLWSYVIYFLTGLYIWRSARDALGVI